VSVSHLSIRASTCPPDNVRGRPANRLASRARPPSHPPSDGRIQTQAIGVATPAVLDDVATLLALYRDGGDVAAPLLSTYLGHVDPKSTYWYLQATPELLEAAADRLEHAGQDAGCGARR